MSTNNYIRQSAQKYHWYKYYSVMRPVSIGTHPKNGMMDFINYDTRTEVNGRMVWAELYYNRELTQKEMEDFEMEKGQGVFNNGLFMGIGKSEGLDNKQN